MKHISWGNEYDKNWYEIEIVDPDRMHVFMEGKLNESSLGINWTHAPCDFCTRLCSQGWAEIAVPVVILDVESKKEPQLEEGYIIAWEYDCHTDRYHYNIQLPLLL